MRILAIDTSCDETAAAVTEDTKVVSNIIWSQATAHAKFGGVMPSLAQRMHQERIDWVIQRALKNAKYNINNLDGIAVTVGPGLSIALGVGVNKAKELAIKFNKPLIPVNHIESHLLSPLAVNSKQSLANRGLGKQLTVQQFNSYPAYGLVVSGGNTIFVKINKVGNYEIIAQTVDDALGEALDKGARMLGIGYPGGAVLEKFSKLGNINKYKLPIPLVGQEKRLIFSYSGLKTSFYRLIDKHRLIENNRQSLAKLKFGKNFPNKQDIYDLSATFQDIAFKHIERVLNFYFTNHQSSINNRLFLGGGVAANTELKKRLRKFGANFGLTVHIPYTKKLCGDNAAMIGVCAYLKYGVLDNISLTKKFGGEENINKIDRDPKLKLV